jgi:putative SOS response-associated peptidase YedK
MCGRYASTASRANLLEQFLVDEQNAEVLKGPDFNVAPTKHAPVVIARPERDASDGDEPVRQLRSFRRGVLPDQLLPPALGVNLSARRPLTGRACRAGLTGTPR